LEGPDELEEMYPDCPNEITVKYKNDTVELVKKHCQDQEFIRLIDDKICDRRMIAKTDYVRCMVLKEYGGFYADLNDCECFLPLRYWVPTHRMILPCDTFNPRQISNFFMYVPKGHKGFADLHQKTFRGFSTLSNTLCNPDVKKKVVSEYLKCAKKFVKRFKPESNPVKILATMMLGKNFDFDGFDLCDVRARVFFPMFVFKYLDETRDFFEYMSEEFLKIGNIFVKDGKVQITHLNGCVSLDECDEELNVKEETLDALEDDPKFCDFLFDYFIRNMAPMIVKYTNFTMNMSPPVMKDLVPFCYVYMNLTGMTMVGHYGDGTSIGN
jgi:hypothetical protein